MLSNQTCRNIISGQSLLQVQQKSVPILEYELNLSTALGYPRNVLEKAASVESRGPSLVQGKPFDEANLNGVTGSRTLDLKPRLLHHLTDATLVGWEALLSSEGHLFSPSLVDTPEKLKKAIARSASGHAGYAIRPEAPEGKAYKLYAGKSRTPMHLPGRFLFLGALEPGNFGSFLFRMLPRLLAIQELGLAFDALIVPERTTWLMATLDLLQIELPIHTLPELRGASVEHIWFIANYENEGYFSAPDMQRIRHFAQRYAKINPAWGDKIYVSRTFSSNNRPGYHPLLNEAEVETALVQRGFEIVHPETLSFRQQLGRFLHANTIVGPSGSGMLNACFAPAGSVVLDLESYSHCVRQHARVYDSSGKRYGFCFGQLSSEDNAPPLQRSWRVALADVQAALDVLSAN
jgi:capsular polysaccharide biosynthesis protein